ncbi:RCC1 domain-containing protein [Archangium violaceum]|uniref:RCC1 domain-containing protein n=1 Tax=Archangium violaceum TaxID=83451 RepID=UPI001F20FDA1|nr:RCC1 domain-containing protein [Archangium violaceum]
MITASTASEHAPTQVPGLSGVVALADSNGALALRADGTLWAWGNNNSGQLGEPSLSSHFSPIPVLRL